MWNTILIQKFIENGTCINPVDHTKDGNYVAEYYNYRFKEFSFSRNENTYSFILEPIDVVGNSKFHEEIMYV